MLTPMHPLHYAAMNKIILRNKIKLTSFTSPYTIMNESKKDPMIAHYDYDKWKAFIREYFAVSRLDQRKHEGIRNEMVEFMMSMDNIDLKYTLQLMETELEERESGLKNSA